MPLVETQADLTPFQRMALIEAIEEKAEREQEAASGNQQGAGQVNSLRQPGGGRGETTMFVNTGEE